MALINTQQAIHIALSHDQAGRLLEAEGVYRHVLAQKPKHATALNMFGVLAVQSRRPHLAVDLIGRAIERQTVRQRHYVFPKGGHLAPGYAEAHNNLANALKNAGRLDEAIVAARNAVLLKPRYSEAHCSLGVALATKGKFDEALDSYRTAIALNPRHADAFSNMGNALAAIGRLDEAISACETALKLNPDSVQAHWILAVVLLRAGEFARGWADYEWRWEVETQKDRRRFETPHCAATE